jgi:hypothetical protein
LSFGHHHHLINFQNFLGAAIRHDIDAGGCKNNCHDYRWNKVSNIRFSGDSAAEKLAIMPLIVIAFLFYSYDSSSGGQGHVMHI